MRKNTHQATHKTPNLSDFFETMEKNKWWIDKPYFNILKKDVMIFVEQVNNYIC